MAWVNVAGAAVATIGGSLLSKKDKSTQKANEAAAEANIQSAEASNKAAEATALQTQIAQDQWNRYREIYEPLERKMVSEAQDYASPDNYAKAAGDASATVSDQFSKARDRLTRTPGLDPSSGAYQSSLVGLDLAQAANDATQQNLARKNVTDTAYARKQAALGVGKGLDSTASSGLGSAAGGMASLAGRYASNASYNSNLAQIGLQNANQQAAALGRVTDRVFSSPTVSNWLNGTGGGNQGLSGVQAGSRAGNGSVQGNSDYEYDL